MLKHIFVISAVASMFCGQGIAVNTNVSIFDRPCDVSDDEDGSNSSCFNDDSEIFEGTTTWLNNVRIRNNLGDSQEQQVMPISAIDSTNSEMDDSFVLVQKPVKIVAPVQPVKSISKLSMANLDDEYLDKEQEPAELENHLKTPTKCYEQLLEAIQQKNLPLSLQRAQRLQMCVSCRVEINGVLSNNGTMKKPLVAVVEELSQIDKVSLRGVKKIQDIVVIVRKCGADDNHALTAVNPDNRKNRYAYNALNIDVNSYKLSK